MARPGICEAFPKAAVIQPGHPSPSSWASSGDGQDSGDVVVQTAGAMVPVVTSKVEEVPPSTVAASGLAEGMAARDSPQARAGVSSASPAGHPTSVPVAPAATRHGHPLSPVPTGHVSALAVGSNSAGLGTAMSSPDLGIPTEEGMGKLPLSNSGTALEQAPEAFTAAVESIAGEPAPGTANHVLEGITAEPRAGAAGPLKGAFPKPGGGTSPPIAQTPIVQPMLGSKASSLVPSKTSHANGLVQQDDIAVEGTLGTTRTTALSHIKLGMGLSSPAISKSTAASHEAAGLPSQEVTSELDKGTSPHTAAGRAEGVTPPFEDLPSASSARATFSPISRTTEPGTTALPAAGHDASQEPPTPPAWPPPAISPAGPGSATAELVASAFPVASATESSEGVPSPTSNDAGPGQGTEHLSPHGTNVAAGDGPPRASTGTPLRATTPSLDTAATATVGRHADPAATSSSSSMEVTAAKDVPAGLFPDPENTTTELVFGTSKSTSRAVTGTASPRTTSSLMGTAPLPSTAGKAPAPSTAFPDDPSTAAGLMNSVSTVPRGSPSPRPFAGTVSSFGDPAGALPTTTAFADPDAATAEAAAGESSPARLSMAMSLPLAGNSARKAQTDVSPGSTAAPSSLGRYDKMTSPAADLSSSFTMSPISEAGPAFGNTPAKEGPSASTAAVGSSPGPGTVTPWDASPMPALPDVSPGLGSSRPGPAVGSPPPTVSIVSDPAPSKVTRSGPVSKSAVPGSSLLLMPSSDMTALVSVTDSSNPDLGSSAAVAKISIGLSPPSRSITFNPATAALGMDTATPQAPQSVSAPNAGVTGEPAPHMYMQRPDATSHPLISRSSPVTPSEEMWSRTAEVDLAGVSRDLSTGRLGAGPAASIPSPGKLHDPTVSPPTPSSATPTAIQPTTATASEPTEGTTTAGTTVNVVGLVSTLETARASGAAAASRAGAPPLLDDSPTTGSPLGVSLSSIAPRTVAATSPPPHNSLATPRSVLGGDARRALHSASPSPDGSTTAVLPAKYPDVGPEEDPGIGVTHLLPPAAPMWRAAGSTSPGPGNTVTKPAVGPSAHASTATPETGWDSTSAKGRSFLVTDDYVTRLGMSQAASLQGHFGAELAPDVPAIAHGTDGTGPASSSTLSRTEPLPELSPQGDDAPQTRPPVGFPLLAPRDGQSAPPALAGASPVSNAAGPLPSTTAAQMPPPASPPVAKSAAAEGARGRSQPAGDGSPMQTAVGSNLVENATADAWTSGTDSENTPPGPAPRALHPSRASVTAQPHAASSNQSGSAAEPMADTSSPGARQGAVGPAPRLPPSITAGAEPGTSNAPPAARSAPGSKSAVAGLSTRAVPSPAPELARAPSPVLGPTAQLGGSASSPVPGSTRPVVVASSGIPGDGIMGTAAGVSDSGLSTAASSSAALAHTLPLSSGAGAELVTVAASSHSPRSPPRPPAEPREGTSEPSTGSSRPGADRAQDGPLAGASSPSTGSTRAGESTATSGSGAGGATVPAETAASSPGPPESSAGGAASLASSKGTSVPVTDTTSTDTRTGTTSLSADSAAPVPATNVPSAAHTHAATLPPTGTLLPLPNPGNLGVVPPEGMPSLLTPGFTARPARGTAAPGEPLSHTVPPSAGSTATGAAADAAVVATASSTAQSALGTLSLLTDRLTSSTSTMSWSRAPMEAAAGPSSLGTSSVLAGPLRQLTSPANSVSAADRAGGTSSTRPTATGLPPGMVLSSNAIIPAGPPRGETSAATAAGRTAETSTARAGFAKATGTSRALSPAAEQPVTNNGADGPALSSSGGVDTGDEGASTTPAAVNELTASPAAFGAAEEETTMMVPDDMAVGNSTGPVPALLRHTATAEPTATMLATVGKDTTAPSQTALALPVFTASPSEATASKSVSVTDSVPAQTAPRTVPEGNEVAASLPSSLTGSTPALGGQITAEMVTTAVGARDIVATISQATSAALAAGAPLATVNGTAVSPHLGPSTTSSGSGMAVLSPTMPTTTIRPTSGSLEVPNHSHAIAVPGMPFPSKHNATEEPTIGPSSVLSDGATTDLAASLAVGYAASKPATSASSSTATSSPVAGQALSTSSHVTQVSLGQPFSGEKTAEPASNSSATIVHDIPGRSTGRVSFPAFATTTSPTGVRLGNSTSMPSSPSSPGAPARLALTLASPSHGTADSTTASPLHIPSDDTANEPATVTSPTVLNSNAAGATRDEPQSGALLTLAKGLTTPQEDFGPFSVFGTHGAVPVPAAGRQAGSQPAFATTSIPPASAASPEPGAMDKIGPSPALLQSPGSGNGVAKTGLVESVTPVAPTTTAVSPHSMLPVPPASPAQPSRPTQASPAKEGGGLVGGTATTPRKPLAATSPTATTAPAFGTQKGPAMAPGASAHTTSSHKNPMLTPLPEPQPTLGLSIAAVSLYPYGAEGNDRGCVERKVDFNSPLFKPEIGFPFGKTLHDFLYFTDNGQIIFPPTDNYVPSNPNPPPQGFSGHESLPMVAAFWDDADFSQGIGTTWYQEYPTLGSTRSALVHDVEAKIKRYMKISYTAKWTLKVTWEEAPAYPSWRDDTQTNTYQAVLTTNGNQAFALLLYQDGGMRWDYTKLAARNVLIGFSSGDGYAQNNELTQKPPAVKYRPDQYRGYDTDLRGLWIYKLDGGPRVNYRLRCLTWLAAQPDPASWNGELLPCPCSRPQAELDPRYRQSRGLADTSMTMLRTSFPSRAGAGVRCVYQDESLLEGWQERFWSLPLHPTTDGELEAFDWCCRRVGKPLLCTRFAEKRPRASCEGYMPPAPASAFGDPHIITLDGLTYTFNGLGDFVLLLASDAQTSFVLQGRTAQTGTAQATNFVAFAAQYISATTTTVEWTLGSQGDIQVLLNYETILFSYSRDMDANVYYNPGILVVNASSITAIFDGAVAVSISTTSGILSMVCSLPDRYLNGTKGLLGVWDHNSADDFQMPNGTSIPRNSSEEEIFSYGMT
ncbi:mucin-4 isoform X2 [Dromaius novaehollandiae]